MWSKTKKQLEDRLCDGLKGRVEYFVTRYHGAPDQEGRFCIRVDGKEYLKAHPYYEIDSNDIAKKLKKENNVPGRYYYKGKFINDEINTYYENLAENEILKQGKINNHKVFEAIDAYLNMDIQTAIHHDNLLIVILALMDARVGKRTLVKLEDTIKEYPNFVQFFYELRLEVEQMKKSQ